METIKPKEIMLEISIIIAIIANFLLNVNPVYQYILVKYKLKKPFSCAVCMSLYMSIAFALYMWEPAYIALPFITPFITSFIEKVYKNLPTPL